MKGTSGIHAHGKVKEVGPAHVSCMGLARTRGWTHEVRPPCGSCVGWHGHVGGRMRLDRHVSYVLAKGGLQVA